MKPLSAQPLNFNPVALLPRERGGSQENAEASRQAPRRCCLSNMHGVYLILLVILRICLRFIEILSHYQTWCWRISYFQWITLYYAHAIKCTSADALRASAFVRRLWSINAYGEWPRFGYFQPRFGVTGRSFWERTRKRPATTMRLHAAVAVVS